MWASRYRAFSHSACRRGRAWSDLISAIRPAVRENETHRLNDNDKVCELYVERSGREVHSVPRTAIVSSLTLVALEDSTPYHRHRATDSRSKLLRCARADIGRFRILSRCSGFGCSSLASITEWAVIYFCCCYHRTCRSSVAGKVRYQKVILIYYIPDSSYCYTSYYYWTTILVLPDLQISNNEIDN
ncbi:hypothetical protein PUN28_006432 [Cardiocondyla obscurior]|uniref:Uncharacterized protein n=1 Tax=Cardiocondyla obscurior TaxID=286306 RepID=A0AAW2GER6_9HYME